MRIREFLALGDVEEFSGNMDQPVAGLVYDSRQVKEGQVFFAIPGGRTDGHEFVHEAVQRGAAGVVVGRKAAWPSGVTWVRVKNVRRAMGSWAALFFGRPSGHMTLIGVTGTNGKTTVTYLVESMLKAADMNPGVIGTINYRYSGRQLPSHYTTPESLDLQALLAEMAESGVNSVAMEVSSHALAQERVRGLDFDVALFTNLSRDHLDYHQDMNDYFAAKSRLFTDYLKASSKPKRTAVIHGGDLWGAVLLKQAAKAGLECWSYGTQREWDIHPLDVRDELDGLKGKIHVRGRSFEFSSSLVGAANLENILGTVGVGFALGLSVEAVTRGIAALRFVPGRLEKIENSLGISVLVDYAHTPDALERALRALRGLMPGVETRDPRPESRNPRLICVFGCGGDRDKGKRPLMGEIAARLSDRVVITSDNPRTEDPLSIINEVEAGVQKVGLKKLETENLNVNSREVPGYCVEEDRRAAIGLALRWARPGDVVLIAGKGHEDYQILGSKRIHFDDREVAREQLNQIADEVRA
ncbi:MAG TPA: UDP-N-acetylmuramoyl-L-alanyl-D-glutamate--2,6-diaminopimelate ligase [Candidatus Binatia bacterium]|nr:UDP-N-acetylmuramoyl-L-alanyl-D-glutamate--2,6-diaminopimelate ligase [Candidatus Binatia bacterium]